MKPEKPLPRYTCSTPFERGVRLCGTCRANPDSPEGRRCARVVAQSASMRALLRRVALIAESDASVVLQGESGTGKEVIARMLHANSARRLKPFVALNCAALPAELLESELFGHARGAFTGANTAREGLVASASGGTLMLDEVAELPLSLQGKLLRTLQDGEVRRLGDDAARHVDVRVLCATHQDLTTMVRERRFRQDLLYRLKVFTLTVPPLRSRVEDVLPLAAMFLSREGHTLGLDAKASAKLRAYMWPGNVRELENAMRHAAVLARGARVEPEHLPDELLGPVAPMGPTGGPLLTLRDAERLHVQRVLAACGGHIQQAADALGIGRTTLWRKLSEYGR